MSQLLATEVENIDIFSVQLRQLRPPITDVRFSAHGSPFYKPIKLNGLVLQHREEVSRHSFDQFHSNFNQVRQTVEKISPQPLIELYFLRFDDEAVYFLKKD